MLGHIRKRDIAGGDFTFGERLHIVQLLRDEERDDIERARDIIECLHNRRVSARSAARLMPYVVEIAEAMIEWLKREQNECSAPVKPEAIAAGAEQLTKEIGDMGAAVSLAERFGISLSDVYKMPYLEVFAIWRVDAAKARFEQRFEEVIKKKYG